MKPDNDMAGHGESCHSEESSTGDIHDDEASYDDNTSNHSDGTAVEEVSESGENGGLDTDFEDKAVACFRFAVLFVLVGAMAGAGVATWHFMTENQNEDFVHEYELLAESVYEESYSQMETILADIKSMSSTVTALALNSGVDWPFFVDTNFHVIGKNFRDSTSADNVAITPLVDLRDKLLWESFAVENQTWIEAGIEWEGIATSAPIESIPAQIYKRGSEGEILEDVGSGPYAPMWEISQSPANTDVVNYDTLSHSTYGRVFADIQAAAVPVLSDLVDPSDFFGSSAQTGEPTSLLLSPVFPDFSSTGKLVAVLVGSFRWTTFFSLNLHEADHFLFVVLDDNCGTNFTLQVGGEKAEFLGYGYHHDRELEAYRHVFEFAPLLETDHSIESSNCGWTMSTYPNKNVYNEYNNDNPTNMTIVVVFVFLAMALMFCLYDCAVHTRQRRILAIAAKSERILSILYPKQIRDRLFGIQTGEANSMKLSDPGIKTESKKKRKKNHVNPTKNAKYQLKTFMDEDETGTNTTLKGTKEIRFGDKPIADLFPHTTVMFADIAGFTAWSSVREPSQVFTLLETVYQAFDVIAKRRRVFKVETVGDCYVAVTGLPEPRKDHAVAMARFARECLSRFNDLVSQLEITLGPDTADLAIRVGLHSGPVTAGVLRGDKSRFQLFGDTVNTAARIESTGKRNKIHVSMETAELLQLASKGNWLRRREQEVEAKGKGKLQTFWLLLKDDSPDSGGSARDLRISDGVLQDLNGQAATPIPQEITRAKNLKAQCADDVDLPPKIQRLVKWNVDVLTRLLKQIVAKRNAINMANSYEIALTQAEGEIRRKFMVLDEVVQIIPLPGFDHRIYSRQVDPNSIELPSEVLEQMRLYVTMIAVMYRDNHFHNFEHASHVMMSVSKLLSRIVAADDLWTVNEDVHKTKDFGFSLHDQTYGITSDPMTQFSVVLAALIHDVDHLGVSNFQLIKEDHKLAKLFKSKSVAEQNSIVLAWDTLMDPRFYELRRTIYTDPFELERFRQLLVNTVLATDIFDKQLQELRKNRWDIAFSDRPVDSVSTKDDINRKATIVIEHLIQASDVAHTMQHWHIYRKWNERLFAEMTAAYQNGRMDKNPADFWFQGELGFFDNYIIPLAKKLQDCGVFGVSSDEYLNYALENRREWASSGEEVLRDLMEKYQPVPKPSPAMNEQENLPISQKRLSKEVASVLPSTDRRPIRRASLR